MASVQNEPPFNQLPGPLVSTLVGTDIGACCNSNRIPLANAVIGNDVVDVSNIMKLLGVLVEVDASC